MFIKTFASFFSIFSISICIASFYMEFSHAEDSTHLPLKSALSKPLTVGIMWPLSGETANLGQKIMNGSKLAIEELEKKNIKFIIEDEGGSSGKDVATAATRLFAKTPIDILVGPAWLDHVAIVAPLAQKRNIPLFTLALCSPETLKYPNVACAYPSTEEQMKLVPPLLRSLKVKRIAFILDDSIFTSEVEEILNRYQREGDIEIVYSEKLSKDLQYQSIGSRIIEKKPDAIFSTSMDPAQSFALFRQLKEMGYTGKRIGYIDVDQKYIDDFGDSINGVFLPGFPSQKFTDAFVARYKEQFKSEPDVYAAQGYDLLKIASLAALQSLEKSLSQNSKGENSRSEDSKAENQKRLIPSQMLATVSNYSYTDSAFPVYRFNADRTIDLPLQTLVIKDRSLKSADKYIATE